MAVDDNSTRVALLREEVKLAAREGEGGEAFEFAAREDAPFFAVHIHANIEVIMGEGANVVRNAEAQARSTPVLDYAKTMAHLFFRNGASLLPEWCH